MGGVDLLDRSLSEYRPRYMSIDSCYMINRVITFVSGVQKSVLVDYIRQNKVKTCQTCLDQNFPYKNIQIYIFLKF